MAASMKALQLRQYMDFFLNKQIRADARKFHEGRNVIISTGTIDTADGSSSVKVGNSTCITGLKAIVVPPSSKLSEDVATIKVRMPHNWDQMQHNHPYIGDSETVSASLANKLSESLLACLDINSLSIIPGKYVWSLDIEVVFLDYDGNYEDVAFLSLISCLRNTSLPKVTVKSSSSDSMSNTWNVQEKLIYSKDSFTKLVLTEEPFNCTFAQLKENFLLDPTHDEESLSSGCLSVTMTYPSSTIRCIKKLGGLPMNDDLLPELIQMASQRCKYLSSQCSR